MKPTRSGEIRCPVCGCPYWLVDNEPICCEKRGTIFDNQGKGDANA